MTGAPQADDHIAALYAHPLGEFTAARDAVARELRAAGDGERAEAIRALRKPSLTAWALNMLPRLRPRELGDLLDAGERAENAQAAVLAGTGDAEELQAAQGALRRQVRHLSDEAGEILVKDGHAAREETLARVRSALEAGAVSDEGRSALLAGVFTVEPEAVGFGAVARLSAGAPSARRAATEAEERVAALRDELRLLRGKRLERERAAAKAVRVAGAKEQEAVKARRRAEREEDEAKRARAEELEAQARLSEAEARLQRRRR
jgi:hypothetical protein